MKNLPSIAFDSGKLQIQQGNCINDTSAPQSPYMEQLVLWASPDRQIAFAACI